MIENNSITILKQQEDALVFRQFDETTAYEVGTALRTEALRRNAPVVIDIRSASRRLFFAALPGSSPDYEDWARRKGNVALRCHASSLRMRLMLEAQDRLPWPEGGLDTKDYAVHGGGVPIRVAGTGVVACIGVSGLPSREDHDLIVSVLSQFLSVAVLPPTPAD